MVWSVTWDQGFVVGGDDNRRLTPNFRMKEFKNAAGAVRVHREVVSALQMLRDRFGRTVSVRGTDADGLGATIAADPILDLLNAADALETHLFAKVAQLGDAVHVRIPDPLRLPKIDLGQALECAFSVTAGFETSGDRFQQITGNFDGAGLSFGPAQWNFKSGTLVPLFRAFEDRDAAALRACFHDPVHYEEWQKVLPLPVSKQIQWANGISTGRDNQEVAEPWKGYFQAVGRVLGFRSAMVEMALRMYGAKLLDGIAFLETLAPGVEIDHLRCVCSHGRRTASVGGLAYSRGCRRPWTGISVPISTSFCSATSVFGARGSCWRRT